MVMVKELDYLGAFRFDTEFQSAVDLIANGQVDVRPLLTRQFPTEQTRDAFLLALDPDASTKVQIVCAP